MLQGKNVVAMEHSRFITIELLNCVGESCLAALGKERSKQGHEKELCAGNNAETANQIEKCIIRLQKAGQTRNSKSLKRAESICDRWTFNWWSSGSISACKIKICMWTHVQPLRLCVQQITSSGESRAIFENFVENNQEQFVTILVFLRWAWPAAFFTREGPDACFLKIKWNMIRNNV